MMDEKEYIASRLNDQISWYSNRSKYNRRLYIWLRIIELISASAIPFLAGIGPVFPYHQWVIGLLGFIIAVSSGISSLYKFHENWIQYRTTAETLKHEKYLYSTKCSPYDGKDAFCKLVQRVESLISKEHSQWSRYIKQNNIS